MPTVNVSKEKLFEKLGVSFSDSEFDELCFKFGIELDEVTPVELSTDSTYKIDIPANRYDLLCIEGISRALLIFLQKIKTPIYKSISNKQVVKTFVEHSTNLVRPYIVTAIIRNVNINKASYNSLLELQEKLHWNLCRKRSLVAIGVHDLSTLSPPFKYSAMSPDEIKFIPLNQDREFSAVELMEFYKSDTHLKPYLHIIKDFNVFPVIHDSKGTVVSLPPIINGNHSKIIPTTKPSDIFIECTATDLNKASVVLDTMVTMLSEHSNTEYISEKTLVIYEETGKEYFYPKLEYRNQIIDINKANQIIGVNLSASEMILNLSRMCLKSKVVENTKLSVEIPPTRHDIIHACDLYEDIAIAFGYDNIVAKLPNTMTIAKQFPINKLTDLLRENTAQAGFTETLTFSLCSIEDECEKLCIPRPTRLHDLTLISNPKTIEFQTARYSMLPGLLKTIQANKKMPLPLKIFEINDVVRATKNTDTGVENVRNFCAVYYNKTPGFEQIHGLLDRIMLLLEVTDYKLNENDHPTFFNGRCAEIIVNGNLNIGWIGVLHPNVLNNFELANNNASALEFNIQPFL